MVNSKGTMIFGASLYSLLTLSISQSSYRSERGAVLFRYLTQEYVKNQIRSKSFFCFSASARYNALAAPSLKIHFHNYMAPPTEVTRLLRNAQAGDKAALDELLPLVYNELRRLAASHLRRERANHTLQPTALVHEAYLRLVDQREVDWRNRAQFFGLAAEMMRRILVNHALSRNAARRGGSEPRIVLDAASDVAVETEVNLVLLDEALSRLGKVDPAQCRIVELRYFGGLTIEETADVLNLSSATIKREWRTARAWLFQQISSVPVRS
jgi:RNA polymerase sigma factor (TIGR02999 family)